MYIVTKSDGHGISNVLIYIYDLLCSLLSDGCIGLQLIVYVNVKIISLSSTVLYNVHTVLLEIWAVKIFGDLLPCSYLNEANPFLFAI